MLYRNQQIVKMAKNSIIESPAINILGAGTSLKGDIHSNGDFRIDGTLKGSINCTGKVVIGATGILEGDVFCKNVDISGKVTGKITVSELSSLKSTSNVNGDLITNQLAIEPGAKFTGTCNMESKKSDANIPGERKEIPENKEKAVR
jgi:cytoskeletal protein CcmA (bactofilin family)